jgi:hypothetical protein
MTGINGMGLLDIVLLVALLLSLRILFVIFSEPGRYSPYHLDCHPYRGEKVVKCTDFREVVNKAGDYFFQLGSTRINGTFTPGYVTGIAYPKDPPRIIVCIEDEKYRALIPKEFMGFPIEVEVTGKPRPGIDVGVKH